MHRRFASPASMVRRALVALVAACSLGSAPAAPAAPARTEPHDRYAPPAPRPADPLSTRAVERLRAEGRAVLWVTFRDKGERDERSFAAAVRGAGEGVGAKARARRARETGGRFVPDWYDVPVVASYVEGVVSTGAALRHVSRWFNAVTVEADEAAARRIATLPFVQTVEAARKSKGTKPIEEGASRTWTPPAGYAPRIPTGGATGADQDAAAGALSHPIPDDYGSATGQLSSINVPAAHDSGYTGAGVIVSMLDTGYDEAHASLSPLKKIAEWDFIQHDAETANQAGDVSSQWGHGTGTWSTLGGYWPGVLVGPAFNASFFIAKTEYVPTETHVEEDNWVAAAEFADSIGADVISSSLGYSDFDPAGTGGGDYGKQQMDGRTSIVTLGAVVAHRRGIVVCNSMGNEGSGGATSVTCPADADSILSVGAVDANNLIAGYSSRGPTWDGRIKPEVVAQGTGTWWAIAGAPFSTGTASGTSLSCPLVGGVAALVREAHPEWTVYQIRQALKETADRAATPDNNYGWGRINAKTAIYNSSLGGPIHPYPFNLVSPAHNAAITSVPVTMVWRRARDPQFGEAITYEVTLCTVTAPAQCVFTTTTADSQLLLPYKLQSSTTYEWWITAKDPLNHRRDSRDRYRFTTGTVTGATVTGAPPAAPKVLLAQSRPNPVSGGATIDFTLEGPAGVVPATLRLFDARGRLIRTIMEGQELVVPHRCSVTWDGADDRGRLVPSGIYYYQMEVAGLRSAKRLVVVR
ncbi:MAG TPA: S8 family serine peptidase [Acidobacteriota bacterium]|nr:S8 family serine peptidase [Acidobacteriota bacterium]